MLDTPTNQGNVKPSAKDPFAALYKADRLLDREEEFSLALAWFEDQDEGARNKLIEAYLPFATKMAIKASKNKSEDVRQDRIAEAHMALFSAVDKFDPHQRFRFSTYAAWWIKASLRNHVYKNHSTMGVGTSANNRRVFHFLNRETDKIRNNNPSLSQFELDTLLAERLDTSIEKIEEMRMRMQGDTSLNMPMSKNGEGAEWIDFLESPDVSTEEAILIQDELNCRMGLLSQAMDALKPRAREIFEKRRLGDPKPTLEILAQEYGVSRERVRQIEAESFAKVQKTMRVLARRNTP